MIARSSAVVNCFVVRPASEVSFTVSVCPTIASLFEPNSAS